MWIRYLLVGQTKYGTSMFMAVRESLYSIWGKIACVVIQGKKIFLLASKGDGVLLSYEWLCYRTLYLLINPAAFTQYTKKNNLMPAYALDLKALEKLR